MMAGKGLGPAYLGVRTTSAYCGKNADGYGNERLLHYCKILHGPFCDAQETPKKHEHD